MAASHYVIRGGLKGRERLRVLARVMGPATGALLEPLVRRDARCLDVGCGGGDVTAELARLAAGGVAVGVDVDDTKLALARGEALAAGLGNVEFRTEDALAPPTNAERFDIVYSRFLLSHLPDAARAVASMAARLAPGGVLVVEDIDASAQFCHPECHAFERFVTLYGDVVRARGADPDIGPKLPGLLQSAGLRDVGMRVVQPAAMKGEVKLLSPITFEAIADAVVAEGLDSRDELDRLIDQLWDFAGADDTVVSMPRVVQTWARRSD
jgi:SAM-dependent methyltransferase